MIDLSQIPQAVLSILLIGIFLFFLIRFLRRQYWLLHLKEGDKVMIKGVEYTVFSVHYFDACLTVEEKNGFIFFGEVKRPAKKLNRYKIKFDHFYFENRWKRKKYSRNSDWTIIGISKWYCGWDQYCYKLCLFGFEAHSWFRLSIKNPPNNE